MELEEEARSFGFLGLSRWFTLHLLCDVEVLWKESFPGYKFSWFLLNQSGKIDGLSWLTQKQLGISLFALYLPAFMLMTLFLIRAVTERGDYCTQRFPVMSYVGATE